MQKMWPWCIAAILGLVLLVVILPPTASSASDPQSQPVAQVADTIKRIESERSSQARATLAMDLYRLVRQVDPASFGPSLVDDLTRLLDDSEESVRMAAASSLGHIGPPAASSIPALERALNKELPGGGVVPAQSAASAIIYALIEIRRGTKGTGN